MSQRLVVTTLLAALAACKGPRAEGPDAELPAAEVLGPFAPGSLGVAAPPAALPEEALAIVDYGPQGRTDGAAAIKIRFSRPVVALGEDTALDVAGRVTFEPPLAGEAYFQTPDLLIFEPKEALREATSYRARLAAGPIPGSREVVARGVEWTFETPRPRVLGATPEAYGEELPRDRRRDSALILRFDQPVSLAEVRAHVTAKVRALGADAAAARSAPVRVSKTSAREYKELLGYEAVLEKDRDFTVRPQELWPAASEVEVAVSPGLVGQLGPLPLDTPWSTRFATYEPQRVLSYGCGDQPTCGLEPIFIRLRNPVREGEARKISISPRPRLAQIRVVDAWDESGGTTVEIAGRLIPGTRYTVQVAPDLKDIFGQRLGAGFSREVVVERRPELALSSGQGTLIPKRKQTIGVESRFVQSLRVRVGALDESKGIDQHVAAIPMPAGAKERTLALAPKGPAGWSSVALDLAELSGGVRGPVLVEVAAASLAPSAAGAEPPDAVRGVFRLTDLGPVALTSPTRSVVQVLRLSDSQPVAGAKVSRREPAGPRELGVTDAQGVLVIDSALAPPGEEGERAQKLLIADPATGDRTALKIGAASLAAARDEALRPGERLLARIVADRGAYRPGELVKVVGWSAVDTPFARSGLGRLAKGTPVKFVLRDPTRAVVAERTVKTTAEGKYWAQLPIPADAKLGRYRVEAAVAGAQADAELKVEDYRVPEFSASASVEREDLQVGEPAIVRVAASYYFGGAVPIERVALRSTCAPTRYRPPGLDETWVVGEPLDERARHGYGPRVVVGAEPDAAPGLRRVELATAHQGDEFPHRCTISAEVTDASFQAVGAETAVQLHPTSFYLAIGLPRGLPRIGERAAPPLRAVDRAGVRVAAKGAKVKVERTWLVATEKAEGGRQVFAGWVEKSEAIRTCALDLPESGEDPRCELPPLKEGTYTIRAEVPAGEGRTARARASFWVSRAERVEWFTAAPVTRPALQTNKTEVKPGETLEAAVQSPWAGTRGLFVLDRAGIREVQAFTAGPNAPASFRFTADDTWTPLVHARAFAVAPLGTYSAIHPEVFEDARAIQQGAEHRRLTVQVEAPQRAGPGEKIEVVAQVRDAEAAPVPARVALWAVDEAVLALTDYEVPDLLPSFLPRRDSLARVFDDYDALILPYWPFDDPWLTDAYGYGTGSGHGFGSHAARAPSVRMGATATVPPARERFETTPIFLADLEADRAGVARAKAALPENLTTFRIFALASARLVDGESPGRFGLGDARTTVTTPFLVRAAAPRQLRPGDAAEVAAIVQNYTAAGGRADVEVVLHDDPATPGADLVALSPTRASVEIPAGGQARVPFQLRADARGEAKLELRASLRAGGAAGRDAVKVALPVAAEPTLTERVAMYGTLADDRAVAIPVVMPGAVRPDLGGVTVSASSTLLGDLQDAVQSLLTYPYGCVEQTSSRLLPVVSLAALHRSYPLGLEGDPREFVKAGVERIASMQTAEGGFAYWPGGKEAHAYASAYATWVLQLASRAGHPVPPELLSKAYDYLEAHLGEAAAGPRWDGGHMIRVAIALHVLAEVGRAPRATLDALFVRRAEMPVFGRAFLLMAMHASDPQRPDVQALTGELLGDLEELPATAHVVERAGYDLSYYFHSDGRNDAIVLAALLRARPDHAVVVKLARGLLERRIGGAWRNTQENAYALVGLVDYARVYEADEPDFVARAWVGRKPVFEASFMGRAEVQARSATAAMPEILRPRAGEGSAASAPLTVVLQRAGRGRMYYRLGAEWAPADPSPPAKEHGVAIERSLRLGDGALAGRTIKIGDPVAVDLTIEARTKIRYVALDIPIPAGLEAVQLSLGKGQRAAMLSGPTSRWVSHQELRADRIVVFFDELMPGRHRHTLHLRATGRGEFQLPPAQARAMYMPEVWGRSAGERVAVR